MGQALTWLLLHICLGSGWLECATMERQGLPPKENQDLELKSGLLQ